MKIALLYNLPSFQSQKGQFLDAELDTKKSALDIHRALEKAGHEVSDLALTEDTIPQITKVSADLIFNYIEWTGRELPLAERAFELITKTGLPYTGASKENYVKTTDKIQMKKLFTKFRIPTPQSAAYLLPVRKPLKYTYKFPAIVKVACEHSGVGLAEDSQVANARQLEKVVLQRVRQFKQNILVEEFVAGRDIEVTILENPKGPEILPPAENLYPHDVAVSFLTYESRWDEKNDINIPTQIAKLSPKLRSRINSICLKAFSCLGFSDYARFDLRIDHKNRVFMIETNSNPGIDAEPNNGLTISYLAAGMSLTDFCEKIVQSSLRRFKVKGQS